MKVDLYELHAKEKNRLPEDWKAFRYECFPKGAQETFFIAITGAVCTERITRGPRKGKLNWRKCGPSTTVNLGVKEHDSWCEEWQKRTGKCHECTGTGEVFSSWSAKEGTKNRRCHKCKGTGTA